MSFNTQKAKQHWNGWDVILRKTEQWRHVYILLDDFAK